VEDAEDAVQDALLSAYKHIGQFEGRSQLSTWLTSIVTNESRMKLRRCSRHEILSLDQDRENDGGALARELRDARPNPETLCAQAEMDEKLRRALDQLSPKLRSAIQMHTLEGHSTRETANGLGISTNTLKSRLARARATLTLLLGEVSGTRLAAKAAPVVDRKGAERRGRNSSGQSELSVPDFGRNLIHNDAQLHMERTQNCYPPHSLENATLSQPQGYAT
jgi:RNA polymerase sigma-70 factor (ECF subfamily)